MCVCVGGIKEVLCVCIGGIKEVLCVCVCWGNQGGIVCVCVGGIKEVLCVCVLGESFPLARTATSQNLVYFSHCLRGQTFVLGRMWPTSPLTPR